MCSRFGTACASRPFGSMNSPGLGYQRLERVFALFVPGPKGLIREEHNAVGKMGVEVADQGASTG